MRYVLRIRPILGFSAGTVGAGGVTVVGTDDKEVELVEEHYVVESV